MFKKIFTIVACISVLTIVFTGCQVTGTESKKNTGNAPEVSYVADGDYAKEMKNCEKLIEENKTQPAKMAAAYAHAWSYAIDNKGDDWQEFLSKIVSGEIKDNEIPASLSADKDMLVNYNKNAIELKAKRDEIFAKYETLSKPSEANESSFAKIKKTFTKFDSLYVLASTPSGTYNEYIKDFASATKSFVDGVTL